MSRESRETECPRNLNLVIPALGRYPGFVFVVILAKAGIHVVFFKSGFLLAQE